MLKDLPSGFELEGISSEEKAGPPPEHLLYTGKIAQNSNVARKSYFSLSLFLFLCKTLIDMLSCCLALFVVGIQRSTCSS